MMRRLGWYWSIGWLIVGPYLIWTVYHARGRRRLRVLVEDVEAARMRRDDLLRALFALAADLGALDKWAGTEREVLAYFEEVAPKPTLEAAEWLRRALATLAR
jgi:hypothetical protein